MKNTSFSDLVGSWQLVESGGQPVYDYQVDYYTFYSDGNGLLLLLRPARPFVG